jgi:hypothetical protein
MALFGTKATPPPVRKPQQLSVVATLDENEYKAYALLASRAEWNSACIVDEALRRFFIKHDWKIYDGPQVEKYLNDQVQRLGEGWRWEWYPLRGGNQAWNQFPYPHPIPLRVLTKVEMLYSEFKDKIDFDVTRVTNLPKGDPFIAVYIKKSPQKQLYIFDVWDEPSFC